MAGGLAQLVAYGAQDIYLSGQPSITFFQAIYKRHTNFAMEDIQQSVNGSASNNSRVTVTIARNGDLVGDVYVRLVPMVGATKTTNTGYDTCWIAERAISDVELTIGGQRIDKHYQAWWRLHAEVFLPESKKITYGKMTSCPLSGDDGLNPPSVYLPLLFFFNRNPGLYLPLIALQYHEVRLDFDIAPNFSTYFGNGTPVFDVWARYVYLDTEERRRFAQKGHEYLIEQVQHTGGDALSLPTGGANSQQTVRLAFNHPVKELIWCYQNSDIITNKNGMWNFTNNMSNVSLDCGAPSGGGGGNDVWCLPHHLGCPRFGQTSWAWFEEGNDQNNVNAPLASFKLIFNGQDRFKEQSGKYFNQVQPWSYHSGSPYPGIYTYSFALEPESHQPSGTCNFSRIDNAQAWITLKGSTINTVQKMFAVNYNILRIQSGMGGLAFSN